MEQEAEVKHILKALSTPDTYIIIEQLGPDGYDATACWCGNLKATGHGQTIITALRAVDKALGERADETHT